MLSVINKCAGKKYPSFVNTVITFKLSRSFNSKKGNPAQHCLDLVKRADYEHFLASLLLPDKVRTDAFAVRALACEVSGVRDNITDKTLGLVRLQFWKETIGW